MLVFEDLHASYGRTPILNGVSFEVPAGSIIALLGGNGTGKSTTLKVAAGLLPPTSGRVTFKGDTISALPAHEVVKRGLCFVAQGKEIFPGMSVEENLMLGAYHRRHDKLGIREDLEARYKQFPRLKILLKKPAGALSGGERQILSIARALMSRPQMLMLDEPSAALAPKIVDQITDIVASLRDQGLTILLVEQNVAMAAALAERLYIVRDGRIVHQQAVNDDIDIVEDLRKFYLSSAD